MKDWNGNKRTTYAQLGASNHTNYDREIRDFYATSSEAIDKKIFNFNQPTFQI